MGCGLGSRQRDATHPLLPSLKSEVLDLDTSSNIPSPEKQRPKKRGNRYISVPGEGLEKNLGKRESHGAEPAKQASDDQL